MSFINAVVMKDSLNVGLDLVSDVAQNPAFAAEEIERQRQQSLSALRVSYDDPGVPGQPGVRSVGLRFPSLRPAADRHAADARRDYPRRPAGVPQEVVRRQQRDPRHRRRRQRRRSVRGGRAGVRQVGAGRGRGRQADRSAAAGAPGGRHRQARLRADRDPRRQHCDSAQARRLHGARSRREGAGRGRREPPPPRPAFRARPDLRRRRGFQRPQADRGHRRARPTPSPRRPAKRCG